MIILKFIIKYKIYRLAQDLLLDIFSLVESEIVKKQQGPTMYLSDRECVSCVQDKGAGSWSASPTPQKT